MFTFVLLGKTIGRQTATRTSGSRTSETGGQIFAEIFERPF